MTSAFETEMGAMQQLFPHLFEPGFNSSETPLDELSEDEDMPAQIGIFGAKAPRYADLGGLRCYRPHGRAERKMAGRPTRKRERSSAEVRAFYGY
jgi:hypothetical protein